MAKVITLEDDEVRLLMEEVQARTKRLNEENRYRRQQQLEAIEDKMWRQIRRQAGHSGPLGGNQNG